MSVLYSKNSRLFNNGLCLQGTKLNKGGIGVHYFASLRGVFEQYRTEA